MSNNLRRWESMGSEISLVSYEKMIDSINNELEYIEAQGEDYDDVSSIFEALKGSLLSLRREVADFDNQRIQFLEFFKEHIDGVYGFYKLDQLLDVRKTYTRNIFASGFISSYFNLLTRLLLVLENKVSDLKLRFKGNLYKSKTLEVKVDNLEHFKEAFKDYMFHFLKSKGFIRNLPTWYKKNGNSDYTVKTSWELYKSNKALFDLEVEGMTAINKIYRQDPKRFYALKRYHDAEMGLVTYNDFSEIMFRNRPFLTRRAKDGKPIQKRACDKAIQNLNLLSQDYGLKGYLKLELTRYIGKIKNYKSIYAPDRLRGENTHDDFFLPKDLKTFQIHELNKITLALDPFSCEFFEVNQISKIATLMYQKGVTRQHVEENPSYIFVVKPTSSTGFWKDAIQFKFELVPISAYDHYNNLDRGGTAAKNRKNLLLQIRVYHLYELYSRRGDIGSPRDFAAEFEGAVLSDYIDVSECEFFDAREADRRIWDACENMPGRDYNDLGFFEKFRKRWRAQREVAAGRLSEREFYEDYLEQEKFYNQWAGNREGFTTRLSKFLDPSIEEIPNVWGGNLYFLTDEQWWRNFVKFYVRGGELRTIDDIIDLLTGR